jgi:hypothetical protein
MNKRRNATLLLAEKSQRFRIYVPQLSSIAYVAVVTRNMRTNT